MALLILLGGEYSVQCRTLPKNKGKTAIFLIVLCNYLQIIEFVVPMKITNVTE